MMAEAFVDLLKDANHWGFEIVAALVEFVVVGLIMTPLVKRWVRNHDAKAHGHKHCEDAHPEDHKCTGHPDDWCEPCYQKGSKDGWGWKPGEMGPIS